MNPPMSWTHCRYEGCRRKLVPEREAIGFCGDECRRAYEEEKAWHLKAAKEMFRRNDCRFDISSSICIMSPRKEDE